MKNRGWDEMTKEKVVNSIKSCLSIFIVCSMARVMEYFIIRTDETVLAENFLHKVFGIIVLAVALWFAKFSWSKIGFCKQQIVPNILKGFALGTVCLYCYVLALIL